MHLHEQNNWIRPLQPGDKSKIKREPKFELPDEELFPEDYAKLRDLSRPNSLATQSNNSSEDTFAQTSRAYEYKRVYQANQMVLFKDPVTQKDSYGRIISEFTENGVSAAPAGIRGEGSKLFYLVEKMGFVTSTRKVSTLLKLCNPIVKEKEVSYGTVEGAVDVENRFSYLFARRIDKKIAEYHATQKLGPKYHFRSISSYEATPDLDSVQSSSNGSSGHRAALRRPREDLPANTYVGVDLNAYANRDIEVESQLSVDNIHWRPLPANTRTYEDYLAESADAVKRPFLKRALNLVLVGDNQMKELESYIKFLIERKASLVKKLLLGKLSSSRRLALSRSFSKWQAVNLYLQSRFFDDAATTIQCLTRRWLCRVGFSLTVSCILCLIFSKSIE